MQPAHKIEKIGLFLGVAPGGGGMFQYAMSLVEALAALPQHYNVHIVYAHEAWQDILATYGLPCTRLHQSLCGIRLATAGLVLGLPRWMTARINPLVRQLESLACDVWIFPGQDALATQTRVPFIASIHDLMHRYEPHFPEVSGFMKYAAREFRFRHLANDSLAVLVDSEVGRQHVVESYGVSPKKIYPLPYIPPRYIWAQPESKAFESTYLLPKKFFFYPAQFWEHKNHIRLLEAAALIRTECPDIHLVFTGGNRYGHAKIRNKIKALDLKLHVTILDYIPNHDLAGFYSRARALIMPTFFGPTNIPPLEAMACGCPMAISGIYGMPEQLGESALYFDPHLTETIAAAMRTLWLEDECCAKLVSEAQVRLASLQQTEFNSRFLSIITLLDEHSSQ